jgi:hypothetical protein
VRSVDAGRQVFRIYAQQPQLLPPEVLNREYGGFIGSLAEKGQREEASLALRGVLSSAHVSDEQRIAVFSGLTASVAGQAILLREILDAQGDARRGGCLALRYIAPDGVATIKKQLASETSWIVLQCPRILIAAAQTCFYSGDRVDGARILTFIGDLFAEESREVAQAAKTTSERVISVQRAIDSGNADQLESELRVASFDALLGDYYQRLKPVLVAEFSEHAFKQQQAIAVVRGLSLLDFSQRSSKHHELLLRAAQGIRCRDLAVLKSDVVKKMLIAYSSKDDAIRRQYISFLVSCVEQAGESDDARPGITFISLLSDIRSDPSLENDIVRSNLAESFLDRGDTPGATMALSSVQTQLPWINRFRLLVKSDAYVLGMVLLGLLVVLRWLFKAGGLLQHASSSQKQAAANQAIPEGTQATDNDRSKDRNHAHYTDPSLSKQAYRELDEYGDCLSKLRLQPGASLSEIKIAYRNIVKALHPDMNPNATKQDTDRFIDLTKTYERLLVLHEERETKGPESDG